MLLCVLMDKLLPGILSLSLIFVFHIFCSTVACNVAQTICETLVFFTLINTAALLILIIIIGCLGDHAHFTYYYQSSVAAIHFLYYSLT